MKKQFLILITILTWFLIAQCKLVRAQILCIKCYNQNDSISDNVTNLLLNGGFENGCSVFGFFCPNSTAYSCDIAGWTCMGGGTNTYAQLYNNSPSIIPEGIYAPYFGSSFCRACSFTPYDTSCINKTDCTVSGIPAGNPTSGLLFGGLAGVSLEQNVNGLVTGNTYVLEFWAGGEYQISYIDRGLFAVDVGFGNTFLRNNPTNPIGGIGTRYVVQFNATSSSHTIKFTNWGHICQTCTELVLDDVRLYTLAQLSFSVPHCILGINNVSASQCLISITPNPVTTELNVKTSNNELSEIILYDVALRKVMQRKFTNTTLLNTEKLAMGLYLYEVKNKDGTSANGKIIKQ